MNYWSAQPNDEVGGWMVTSYPHPSSQHGQYGTDHYGDIVADCMIKANAEIIAMLLNDRGAIIKNNKILLTTDRYGRNADTIAFQNLMDEGDDD
jgi:hypothetical protein